MRASALHEKTVSRRGSRREFISVSYGFRLRGDPASEVVRVLQVGLEVRVAVCPLVLLVEEGKVL